MQSSRRLAAFLVCLVLLAGCSGGGSSDAPTAPPSNPAEDNPQPGEPLLDPTFGTGGVVVDEIDFASGAAVITDATSRIIVAGSSTGAAGDSDLAVWRFQEDGTPDPGFGVNGVFLHDSAAGGGGDDGGLAVTIDSSGRILVAGYSASAGGDLDLALWRIDDAGVLDGIVTIDNMISGPNQDDQGLSVAIDSQDRIIVAGRTVGGAMSELAVWRFLPDGSADVTFAFSGQFYSMGSQDQGNAVTVDDMDRVLVTGFKDLSLATWRLTESGAPDINFGVNGLQAISFAGASLSGTGIVRDGQGRLLLSAIRDFGTGVSDVLSFRLLPDGGVDLVYGGAGFTEYMNPLGSAVATGIALDPMNRVVMVGTVVDQSGTESVFDAAAWRLDADGFLDPDFGGNGTIFFDSFPDPVNSEGRALAVDVSGRIVLAGASSDEPNLDQDTVVWRLDP